MSFTDQFRVGPAAGVGPVRVAQTPHPDAEGITITNVDLPDAVDSGSSFTVEVEVEISTPSFRPLYTAPDHCTRNFYQQGFDMAVNVDFGSGQPNGSATDCARAPSLADATLGQTYTTTFPVEVTAPSADGQKTIEIQMVGNQSGRVMGTTSRTIEVRGEEDNGGGTDPGDPDPPEDECGGLKDTFTENECCPLNPDLTFRVPPRVGRKIDLQEDAPNLCAWTPVGLVVLVVLAYVVVNLSPTSIAGDILG